MKNLLPYDDSSPESIENYSKKLIDKSFQDVLYDYFGDGQEFLEKSDYYNNPRGKGSLGNLIEKYFFFYEPNSDSEPDFPKAGVELKVTPYEKLKSGKYRAGERLVISMIPNDRPVFEDIHQSHVLDKLKLVLLILYLREKQTDRIKFRIDYSKLFSVLGESCREDLQIIESDYKIIIEKIKSGKAHELSESDTMYLGACTKGASAAKSLQPQFYNSDIKAKRRAFSLKQGYMTYIINKYIFGDIDTYEPISDKMVSKSGFEKMVISKINNFKGKKESDLRQIFGMENDASKDIFSRFAFAMLGVKSNNAEEFLKSDTVVKAIRIEKNDKIKESMSFPAMKFKEFVNEEWEDSAVYNYFSEKRFLFVVYKDNGNGYELLGAKFWNMSNIDLEKIGKMEWLKVQNIVKDGVVLLPKGNRVTNNFPKASETEIFHVRPHAAKSAYLINGKQYGKGILERDADILPNGDMMTKQCFWLNKDYILRQLEE